MKVNIFDPWPRSQKITVFFKHAQLLVVPLMHTLHGWKCFPILLFNTDAMEAKVRILHLLGQEDEAS